MFAHLGFPRYGQKIDSKVAEQAASKTKLMSGLKLGAVQSEVARVNVWRKLVAEQHWEKSSTGQSESLRSLSHRAAYKCRPSRTFLVAKAKLVDQEDCRPDKALFGLFLWMFSTSSCLSDDQTSLKAPSRLPQIPHSGLERLRSSLAIFSRGPK